MNFNFLPSLKHATLASIIFPLLKKEIIWQMTIKSQKSIPSSEVIASVREKIETLPLPKELKSTLSCCLETIVCDYLLWLLFLSLDFPLISCDLIISATYWTILGEVDIEKTVKSLIQNENVDIHSKYRLASVHCMEKLVVMFWPEYEANFSENPKPQNEQTSTFESCSAFVCYWNRVMKTGRFRSDTAENEKLLKEAICKKNTLAMRHLWNKMSEAGKNNFFDGFLSHSLAFLWIKDFVRCVLPTLKDNQLYRFISAHGLKIFRCFLDWPFVLFLEDVAEHLRNVLSEENFSRAVEDVILLVKKDGGLTKLQREFCCNDPEELRSMLRKEKISSSC